MSGKIVGVKPLCFLDFLLWPLLWLLRWEKMTNKSSYWWQWRKYPHINQDTHIINIAGDSQLDLHSFWHSVFWGTNFTWRKVVIFRPKIPVVYQVGFKARGHCQLCTLQISGKVRLLIGPEDTYFFGITADGQPLELSIVGYADRQEPKNIPLI